MFVLAGTPESAELVPQDAMPSMDEVELAESVAATSGSVARLAPAARRRSPATRSRATRRRARRRCASVRSCPRRRSTGSTAGWSLAMPLAPAQEVFATDGTRRPDHAARRGRAPTSTRCAGTWARPIDGVGIVGAPGDAAGVDAAFLVVQLFTSSVGAILVLAALVLVFHTMSMATAERRTEIGLARSLGSTRRQLLLGDAGRGRAARRRRHRRRAASPAALLAVVVVPLARVAYAGGAPVDLPTGVSFQAVPAAGRGRRRHRRRRDRRGRAGAVGGARRARRRPPSRRDLRVARPRSPDAPSRHRRGRRRARWSPGWRSWTAPSPAASRIPWPSLPGVARRLRRRWSSSRCSSRSSTRAAAGVLERLSPGTGRLAGDAIRANPRRTTINVMALLLPVAIVVTTTVAFDGSLERDRPARRRGRRRAAERRRRLVHRRSRQPRRLPTDGGRAPVRAGGGARRAGGPAVPERPPPAAGRQAGASSPPCPSPPPSAPASRTWCRSRGLATDPAAFDHALADGGIAASRFAARALDLDDRRRPLVGDAGRSEDVQGRRDLRRLRLRGDLLRRCRHLSRRVG